jgi:hypothetical protein
MQLEIERVDQFYEVVYPAYQRLKTETGGESTTLEVVLAPGIYERTNLNLDGGADGSPVRLVLRGRDPANPPVLTDLSLHLSSAELGLENLVFRNTVTDVAVVDLQARSSLEIVNCAFLNNASQAMPGGDLFAFGALGPTAKMEVRDCWFIGNRTRHINPLLALQSGVSASFAQASFDNVVFLNNAVAAVIAPYGTSRLNLVNCLAGLTRQGAEPAVLFNLSSSGPAVTVENSLIAGQSAGQLVRRSPGSEDTPPAVELKHSQILVQELPAATPILPDLILSGTTLTSLEAVTDKLAQLVETGTAEALAGKKPDFTALKSLLLQ